MKPFHALLAIFTLSLNACWLFEPIPNYTDNAWYEVQQIRVRLVHRFAQDTVYRTNYQMHYDLDGTVLPKLETTGKLDSTEKLGVIIKLNAPVVTKGGEAFYGEYPKNGLLREVLSIDIYLENEDQKLNLKPYLKGDSTISEVKYRNRDFGLRSYGFGRSPSIVDVETWVKMLNNGAELGRIPIYDYIFWFDPGIWKDLNFAPTHLSCKMQMQDSLGYSWEVSDGVPVGY